MLTPSKAAKGPNRLINPITFFKLSFISNWGTTNALKKVEIVQPNANENLSTVFGFSFAAANI